MKDKKLLKKAVIFAVVAVLVQFAGNEVRDIIVEVFKDGLFFDLEDLLNE